MQWYLAKIIFNIQVGNKKSTSQFDEQLRLILAIDYNEALYKAKQLGRKEETSFINGNRNEVIWKFIDVAELSPLIGIKDGTEIYSTTYETDEANDYISYVQRKAKTVLSNSLIL